MRAAVQLRRPQVRRREADVDRRRRVRQGDQQAGAGRPPDLGAQDVPADAGPRRHRRSDHEVPQVVQPVLRGTVRGPRRLSDGLERAAVYAGSRTRRD